MSAPTSLCRDVASTTPSLDRPQTKDDRGALQSPGLAERGHRKREKDAPTTSRKTSLFHRQARSSPRLSFLHDALHDDFTLRSVVTVVANSCPPTHSVTIEEADRGLSCGSILFPFSRREKEKRIERLSLSSPSSLVPSSRLSGFAAQVRSEREKEREIEREKKETKSGERNEERSLYLLCRRRRRPRARRKKCRLGSKTQKKKKN